MLGLLVLLSMTTAIVTKSSDRNRCCFVTNQPDRTNSLKLKVHFASSFTPGDSVVLVITNRFYLNRVQNSRKQYIAKIDSSGTLSYNIDPENSSGYFTLYQRKKITYQPGILTAITNELFFESGDDIILDIENRDSFAGVRSTLRFSGPGHEKYELKAKLDSFLIKQSKISKQDSTELKFILSSKKLLEKGTEFIDKNSTGISKQARNVLQSDLVFQQAFGFTNQIDQQMKAHPSVQQKNTLLGIVEYAAVGRNIIKMDSTALAISHSAPFFFYYMAVAASYVHNKKIDAWWIYNFIKGRYSGNLRDRIVMVSLINSQKPKNVDSLYRDALLYMRDKETLKEMEYLAPMFLGGHIKSTPVLDAMDREVEIAKYQGKIVVLDFWYYGCGMCATLYQDALKQVEESFKNDDDVVFFSVNIDKKERWLSGIQSGLYTSPLAVNTYTGKLGTANQFVKNNALWGFPTIMLLDQTGKIVSFNTINLYNAKGLTDAINVLKK